MAEVNWLAIALAAIASMILGSLWYSPLLFGKKWMKIVGIKESDKGTGAEMAVSMILGLIGAILTAFVLAKLLAIYRVQDIKVALTFAFWVWLGFQAPICLGAVSWERKPWSLFFINGGYYLVNLLIAAAIIIYV